MSATADKARYFLERSVPELKELERKQIFTPAEITSISSKRSDFEHKINARGSIPSDFSAYATFEVNVDTLKRKRIKRLGIKNTTHNGQTRVFFVFDRALRKFPGDLGLWTQAIEYAIQQNAHKKATRMFTDALRLNPTCADLWIMAARNAIERNGSMFEARGFAQRGLRFCKRDKSMWTEYFKLEMLHGVVEDGQPATGEKEKNLRVDAILPSNDVGIEIDQEAIMKLDSISATSVAVLNAIFDAAMLQFDHDFNLAKQFFDIAFEFDAITAYEGVIEHIYRHMSKVDAEAWQTKACDIAMAMYGLTPDMPEFSVALRETLNKVNLALKDATKPSGTSSDPLWEWCDGYLENLWRKCTHQEPYRIILESALSKLAL